MMKLPRARPSAYAAGARPDKLSNGGLQLIRQHMQGPAKIACAECLLRRDAIPGHLGGYTPEMYLEAMRGPASIACHMYLNRGLPISGQKHCTGVSVFRANVGHVCHVNGMQTGAQSAVEAAGKNAEQFFATDQEFHDYHKPAQEKA